MPFFNYTARDANGTEITGTIDALNELAARTALQAIELEPIFIQVRSEELNVAEIPNTNVNSTAMPVVNAKQWEVLEPVKPATANIYKDVQPIHENWTTFKEEEAYERKDDLPVLPADSLHYEKQQQKIYYPFSETIRLYAGWLLAWYGLVYALAHFEQTRQPLPAIPYVAGLLYSPAIRSITVACFIYLLFQGIMNKYFTSTSIKFLFSLVGIALLTAYIFYT